MIILETSAGLHMPCDNEMIVSTHAKRVRRGEVVARGYFVKRAWLADGVKTCEHWFEWLWDKEGPCTTPAPVVD